MERLKNYREVGEKLVIGLKNYREDLGRKMENLEEGIMSGNENATNIIWRSVDRPRLKQKRN